MDWKKRIVFSDFGGGLEVEGSSWVMGYDFRIYVVNWKQSGDAWVWGSYVLPRSAFYSRLRFVPINFLFPVTFSFIIRKQKS